MQGQSLTVLDLCAGSGAIGVAVAKAIPTAQITFVEIDSAHLSTIRKNLEVNLPQTDHKNHTVVLSDLFTNVSGTFDYILTNPPYIDVAAGTVNPSVEQHEPHLALFGGIDGMEVIVRIMQQAKDRLTPTGELWIEHEPFQAKAMTSLAAVHGYDCTNHVDQYGTVRYSILTKAVAK
jgi:release factor glutamine methyltransferase